MTLEIPIVDSINSRIGYLSAFTDAILESPVLIEMLCSWRNKYRQFFFTQFEGTPEKTRAYVQMILADPTRMMFFIYTAEEPFDDAVFPADHLPIGHIGVMHLDRTTVELDNMIRGRDGGHPHLMYWSEVALLKWVFRARTDRTEPATKALCRLLDDNWRTIRHHSRVGFKMVRTLPLLRWEAAGVVHLQPFTDGECRGDLIETSLGEMELTSEEFFSLQRGESCTK